MKNYFAPYFRPGEFDSPDLPGSGRKMNPALLSKLNQARKYAAIPFHINSGYRTPQHNKLVGGVPGSAHTKGMAVDIRANTPEEYKTILTALIRAGFKRIGLGRKFIHADIDYSKPTPAVWTYPGAGYNLLAARLQKILLEAEKKNEIPLYHFQQLLQQLLHY